MIFAFYLGIGLAFVTLFLNGAPELAGPTAGAAGERLAIPLIASTILLMGFWVAGARVVFSMPLQLRANWVFRVLPFRAGAYCLRGRRRALMLVSVLPAWLLSAALLLSFWSWKPATAHLGFLLCLGTVLAEFSADGVQRLPFTCSYLPGRSNLHLTFWLWIVLLFVGVMGIAVNEVKLLTHSLATAAVMCCLATCALAVVLRNNWLADPRRAELRFEEERPDRLLSLDLS